eukprot:NODE_2075_length_1305_cov_29.736465_g1888_i0.p1 GENE.NODE_2075_length_1305_cov_29.736465_g1888_i0~~NODE_2075_length_1305_cov_29.736465_g1888_i0.p1  ORF type:complete len:347 (-),score=43.22 NODE_2075_length_1305_cov_29.736465_g1888_i0:153-1193(-)
MANSRQITLGVLASVSYCLVNLILNILNGWLFLRSPFRFPLSLTVIHMCSGYFITAALFRFRPCAPELFVMQKVPNTFEASKKMMILGFLSGANIALNNVSLLYINVALNQIVKAFNPVLIAMCDVGFRGVRYRANVWMGLLAITTGVVLTVLNNPQFQLIGFLCCMGSSVASAVQTTLAEQSMTEDLKLDANNFLYHTSMWSGLSVLPLALLRDFDVFAQQIQLSAPWLILMVVVTTVLGFLNNLTLLMCIKLTGGSYSAVVGNAKIILIILVQQALWPEDARQLKPVHWMGMSLTVLSFAGLSVLKYRAHQQAAPKIEADLLAGDEDQGDIEIGRVSTAVSNRC